LTLGLGDTGDEWDFQRIGTESEKVSVEKELQELKTRLSEKDKWEERKREIEMELAKVWTVDGNVLDEPEYVNNSNDRLIKI